MSRGARTLRVLALLAGTLVVGLGSQPAIASAPASPAASKPVASSNGRSSSGVSAAYGFGNTVRDTEFGGSTIASRSFSERYAFRLTQTATRFRVHIRNADMRENRLLPGSLSINGVWLGADRNQALPGGSFRSAPTRVASGATVTNGADYVTPWVSPSRYRLTQRTTHLLSFGFSTTPGTQVGVAFSGTWLNGGLASASAIAPGRWADSANLLDVWIEYDVATHPTVLLAIGHSINTPGNVVGATSYGELTSWPQLWAQASGGIAVTDAIAGGLIQNYTGSGTLIAAQYPRVRPDVVTIWSTTNDIAQGATFPLLQAWVEQTITRVKHRYPGVKVVLATETPRRDFPVADAQTAVRQEYNAWVRSHPSGVDAVADVDAYLANTRDSALLPQFDSGDHVHMSVNGHAAVMGIMTLATRSLGF